MKRRRSGEPRVTASRLYTALFTVSPHASRQRGARHQVHSSGAAPLSHTFKSYMLSRPPRMISGGMPNALAHTRDDTHLEEGHLNHSTSGTITRDKKCCMAL